MGKYQCPQEWSDWGEWLAAGLHGQCRWRLPVLLMGMLFATGRRTVAAPVNSFASLEQANDLDNIQTLYLRCHRLRTERER